eukprot:6169876-Prymnesium_polylepis.1
MIDAAVCSKLYRALGIGRLTHLGGIRPAATAELQAAAAAAEVEATASCALCLGGVGPKLEAKTTEGHVPSKCSKWPMADVVAKG